jgi:hypothetical protein
MQAVINVNTVRIADVSSKDSDGNIVKAKQVAFSYTYNGMTKNLVIPYPATVQDMKDAVAACVASCNTIQSQTDDLKSQLSGNATIEI